MSEGLRARGTAAEVAATSSRLAKSDTLARFLERSPPTPHVPPLWSGISSPARCSANCAPARSAACCSTRSPVLPIARASDRPAASVRRDAMLSGDLGATALLALTGTAEDLDDVGLQVGRPVAPMLAATAATPTAALKLTGEASVGYKLDDARIQVHRSG